jgi:2-keto-4-pentenoate hydratase/2-oxohepta-3-ene-1,7-dioic acid hydratase in catechol pathway
VELTIVIGKAAKNVPEKDALDYVLGYTAANDVSEMLNANHTYCPTLLF